MSNDIRPAQSATQFEAIITSSSETEIESKSEINKVAKNDATDINPPKTSNITINKSVHVDKLGSNSAYLTPDLVNLHQPSFGNDGFLQDVSPGIFSMRTVSTSALNDGLYWDSSNNENIGHMNKFTSNLQKVKTDATPLNKIYDITEGTTLAMESQIVHGSEDSRLSTYNNQLTKMDINKVSPLFKTPMAPQIDEAAQMLRSEIYQIPNFVGRKPLPVTRNISPMNSTIHKENPEETSSPFSQEFPASSSPIKLCAYKKHPTDSGNVYMDNPFMLSGGMSPIKIRDHTNDYSNINRWATESEASFGGSDIEKDRAESPHPDIPNSMEKEMPFQHAYHDSSISLNLRAPKFTEVFSIWKIIVVLLTCIIMPPFFYIIYYADRGGISSRMIYKLILNKEYLRDPLNNFYWDVDITWFKKLCFWLGLLELLIISACICIGFGVGLTRD
ncbi:similar to Saccharomyces cerevisiae YGR041W BUD9 Protein involved in bud-site selection [Maudiozyma saulgeensis]|uniref:Similar to Saccharomyces cerevisiae YGR041W BUD9 Protein involved in bud-site selection n=1 Tax=Maudiozyma saulgeensis TaxID=1789683 RepID=A0A1X7QZ74_9SACH|nr:similar to Saccharomyces cerevisiae YGR041W BUD9 Protein involved in bud-site selection [Kazachstania saulgeensis]